MKFKLILCSALVGMLAVSCFDDNYNLDDIDTTSRVTVNDLVIPVNFGEVLLSDVIELDENSDVKEMEIDGRKCYVLQRTGSFDSEYIRIEQPEAAPTTINPTVATLYAVGDEYPLLPTGNEFTFTCDNVDSSIVDIESVKIDNLTFTITFTTGGLPSGGAYENVRLQLPLAMTATTNAGSYNPADGVWTIDRLAVDSKGVCQAVLTATAIDFTKNPGYSFVSPRFKLESEFSIISGSLKANGTPAQSIDFRADFTLGRLVATAVTGFIHYYIEGMDIESINLTDLPEFLEGGDTNVTLLNPMICLQTTNPVAPDKLSYQASLALTANRDGSEPRRFTSDVFTVGSNRGIEGPYNTILTPSTTPLTFVPEGFRTDFNQVTFPGLGSIFAVPDNSSVKGLPKTIDVSVLNPQIPRSPVTDFELGRDIPGVTGNYELFAPFALVEGSVIVYSSVKDGWGEDVEDLTINSLTVTALATNNTSLGAELFIYPLDKDGNRLPNVEIKSTFLESGALNQPITFTLSGTVTKLDGVEFVARMVSHDSKTLSPDETLSFKDVRLTVSGYYEREL